jgi:hypothetical protein
MPRARREVTTTTTAVQGVPEAEAERRIEAALDRYIPDNGEWTTVHRLACAAEIGRSFGLQFSVAALVAKWNRRHGSEAGHVRVDDVLAMLDGRANA